MTTTSTSQHPLFFNVESIIPHLQVQSKKQALQVLSTQAAQFTGLHERTIFDVLLERERLGTTSLGHGTAIPHGKIITLQRIYGSFARLDTPIDFDSIDDQPVDLLFLILAPEKSGADHLNALSYISRHFRNPHTRQQLRNAPNAQTIYTILSQETTVHDT